VEVKECSLSDGIKDFCYLGESYNSYIDEYGKVNSNQDVRCATNQMENKC